MNAITRIPKILIADDDQVFSRRLCDFLKERGFACKTSSQGYEALELIEEWKPQVILYDMMLPEINAIAVLEKIQSQKLKQKINTSLMVTSGHNVASNVRACIHAGADDFIIKPCSLEDILSRIVFHLQKRRTLQEMNLEHPPKEKSEHYLYLTEMLLRKILSGKTQTGDLIFDLLQMQALAVDAVRCSLVKTYHQDMKGFVLSSSDDRHFKGFELNLHKYPEITAVLHTEKLIAIDNLGNNATMAKVQNLFKDIAFNSMIVCPVWDNEKIYGVVSTRLSLKAKPLNDADIRFAQILSHSIGLILQKDRIAKENLAA